MKLASQSKLLGLRHSKWAKIALQIVLLSIIYFGIQAYNTRFAARGMAPPIQGEFINGKSVSLTDFSGKPVLIHFWATWCPICRMEQSSIDAIAQDNYAVITIVSQSGSKDEIRKIIHDRGIKAPVLIDENDRFAKKYGIKAYPTTFVLDSQGKIRHIEVGYTTELGLKIRMWLAGIY